VIYMVGGRDVRHTSLHEVELALKAGQAGKAGQAADGAAREGA